MHTGKFVRKTLFAALAFAGGIVVGAIDASGGGSDQEIAGERIVLEMLAEDLWTERDAYDAGHYLMVPLHHTFEHKGKLRVAFQDHFERMVTAYRAGEWGISGIGEMQYLALASRYLALNAHDPNEQRLNAELADVLHARVSHYWQELPAWQWERKPFPGGIRERLQWKLETGPTKRSYYRLVFDQEMYVIGMAADLGVWKISVGESCGICDEALDFFDRIMGDRLDRSREGWNFQEGMMSDHRDYAFAAYVTKPESESDPVAVASIQGDSSHAHRWPLWLVQIGNHRDVDDLVERLRWQLLNRVYDPHVDMGVPVLRNYMSGHNGYYRWKYRTLEADSGYGPYQLSGTFSIGWWSFLGGDGITAMYEQLENAYPLNPAQLRLYRSLATRERHPLVADAQENGLSAAIARMATMISRRMH